MLFEVTTCSLARSCVLMETGTVKSRGQSTQQPLCYSTCVCASAPWPNYVHVCSFVFAGVLRYYLMNHNAVPSPRSQSWESLTRSLALVAQHDCSKQGCCIRINFKWQMTQMFLIYVFHSDIYSFNRP